MPHKVLRTRRTKAEIERLWEVMLEELVEHHPQSVRHVYYRMVVRDLVAKTEAGYDTVQIQLVKMRRAGVVPYGWITDGTRWCRRVETYNSVADALAETARLYRRNLWSNTGIYIEAWCESNSIADVIDNVTEEYAVSLFPAGGTGTLGFIYPSAIGLARAAGERPAHILYVGDWDPTGKMIPEKIETELRVHAPDTEIHFHRIAVNPDQIRNMNLPGRPPKTTDSRARKFQGLCVEAEAIPVDTMRAIVRTAIEAYIDPRILQGVEVAEESERGYLLSLAEALSGAALDDGDAP